MPRNRILYCVDGNLINGSIPILEQSLYWHDAGWSTQFVSTKRSQEFDRTDWEDLVDTNLQNVDWWKEHKGAEQAVFYSLAARPAYMRAARRAGLTVTIDADSECVLSPRQSLPRWNNRYQDARHSIQMRMKIIKRLLIDRLTAHSIESATIAQLESCHYLKVESTEAANNVKNFLRLVRRLDLESKIVEIPFPVRSEFLNCAVSSDREFSIAIMGRLADQQKDPAILLQVLRSLLAIQSSIKCVIMTRELTEPFRKLAEGVQDRVTFIQGATREVVADFLSRSAVFLSTSRVESLPVAALEAACAGCAIVGTPLAGFRYLCTTLKFGEISKNHACASVLNAYRRVEKTLSPRSHARIAADARSRFSLPAVTQLWVEHFKASNR